MTTTPKNPDRADQPTRPTADGESCPAAFHDPTDLASHIAFLTAWAIVWSIPVLAWLAVLVLAHLAIGAML